MPALAPTDGPRPKAVLDSLEYDFGRMERDTKRSHTFVIRNEGQVPLILSKGDSTCKCTLFNLANDAVPPGSESKVELEWEARAEGGTFRQSATIFSNDPENPRIVLTITGLIHESLELDPREVVLSDLSRHESRTVDVKLLALGSESLAVRDLTWNANGEQEFFSASSRPMTAEELPNGVKSGVIVSVTVKPGLPLGQFHQKISLRSNLKSRAEIEIPVSGRVLGDVSIIGKGWNPKTEVLSLGNVKRNLGTKQTILLMARGPKRHDLKFTPSEVTPGLKVTVGAPEAMLNGEAARYPVTIEVVAGQEPVSYVGSKKSDLASVVLESNAPEVGSLRLLVQYIVNE
jgi:hypothetical protein